MHNEAFGLQCLLINLPNVPDEMGGRSSKNRLCKEDLEFLKEKTRYDESTITEWYKGFIQVNHDHCELHIIIMTIIRSDETNQDCPDGLLTQSAFMKIYSKCFPAGNAKEFCDHVFRFQLISFGYFFIFFSGPLTETRTIL